MNSSGGIMPCTGWLPAHQRLGVDGPLGGDVDLGLEVQLQLVARRWPGAARRGWPDGAASARRGPARRWRYALWFRFASYMAMSARFMSVSASSACSGIERDAHAGVDVDGDAAEDERRLAARVPMRCATSTALARVAALEHHRELVAAEAGHGVALADGLAQAPADLDQQLVAEVMAEGVVDLLEAVEVHHDHARPSVAAAASRRRSPARGARGTACGSAARSGVVRGLVADLLLARARSRCASG